MALSGSPSLSDVHLNDDGLPVAHNGVRHQPVFFLFIAAPRLASVGWASLCTFLFLYMSLVMRINLFRGVHFSLVWWAYNVPDDERSLATAVYASAVTNVLTKALAVGLSGMASITIAGVLMTTMYHAFVRKDLFPRCVHRCHAAAQGKFNKILAHFRASGDGVKDLVFTILSTAPPHRQRIQPQQRQRVAVVHGAWPPQSRAVGHFRSRHGSDILVGPTARRRR